ncbi:hypothetical protein [Rhizobium sp. BK312]
MTFQTDHPWGQANLGKITLKMIKVQIGCYLGEDDIFSVSDGLGQG